MQSLAGTLRPSLVFAVVVEGHMMSECLSVKVRIKDGEICQTAACLCGLKHSLIRAAAAAAMINTLRYTTIRIPGVMILFHTGRVNVNIPKTLYPSVLGKNNTILLAVNQTVADMKFVTFAQVFLIDVHS